MPYPAAHSLLTFSGPAYGGQEEWSTGLRLDTTTPPTVAMLEDAGDAFRTLIGTQYLGGSARVALETVKWAPQDTSGLYGGGERVEYIITPPVVMGSMAAIPQICFVVSLRTAKPRGRGSNGRMYLPAMPELQNDNTGQIQPGHRDAINTAFANFVGVINGIFAARVVVGSKAGSGLLEPVTGTRCGRVLDTQRRRRAGIPEDYSQTLPVDF